MLVLRLTEGQSARNNSRFVQFEGDGLDISGLSKKGYPNNNNNNNTYSTQHSREREGGGNSGISM